MQTSLNIRARLLRVVQVVQVARVARVARVGFCAAFALALLISACRKSEMKSETQRGTAERPFVIGMSQCNLGEPWRVQMNEDIKKAAATHPTLHVVFKDAQNDSL